MSRRIVSLPEIGSPLGVYLREDLVLGREFEVRYFLSSGVVDTPLRVEDYVFIHERGGVFWILVCDGSSEVYSDNIELISLNGNLFSWGQLPSRVLADVICNIDEAASPTDVIAEGTKRYARILESYGFDPTNPSLRHLYGGCCLSLCKVGANGFTSLVNVGDTLYSVLMSSGERFATTNQVLPLYGLSQEIRRSFGNRLYFEHFIPFLRGYVANTVGPIESFTHPGCSSSPVLPARFQLNLPKGFGFFNGDPNVLEFCRETAFYTSEIEEIALFTDGIFPYLRNRGEAEEGSLREVFDFLKTFRDMKVPSPELGSESTLVILTKV